MTPVSIPSRHCGRTRKLADEQEIALCRDLAAGMKGQTIAEKYGVSRFTVYAIRKRRAAIYLRFLKIPYLDVSGSGPSTGGDAATGNLKP